MPGAAAAGGGERTGSGAAGRSGPFAGVSVCDALDSALIPLRAGGVETARLDAELLLADALGVDRAALVAHPERELDGTATRRFGSMMRRRAFDREPVAYILGRKAFRHIELAVDRRVFIPRPETETLVEAALDLAPRARVVEVGTGSGAVALALKDERPDLEVVATEVDQAALAVARENAARLGLEVAFVEADLLDGVEGPFDAVLSNPPYVGDAEVRWLGPETARHEPPRALFGGGPQGLELLRRLVPQAAAIAAFVAFEVGAGQAPFVVELMEEEGLERIEAVADLAGIERVVVGRR